MKRPGYMPKGGLNEAPSTPRPPRAKGWGIGENRSKDQPGKKPYQNGKTDTSSSDSDAITAKGGESKAKS